MKRNIILHAHIFKNAGTTIDWVLERNFGRNFRDDRDDQKMLFEPNYLLDILMKSESIIALSSHSLPLPVKESNELEFHTIVMLRHPLLRIRSVYDFERKQKHESPGAIHAKKYTFSEYVSWRMKPEVGATIRNMHVRYLTRNLLPNKKVIDKQYFDFALEYVESNFLVGIVEKFDQSMVVFENNLKDYFPSMSFAYQKQNITQTKSLTEAEKIDNLKADLGDTLYEQVVEQNKFDIELYQATTKLIVQRFNSIDNCEEKLAALQK